jgi:hypothetical protein
MNYNFKIYGSIGSIWLKEIKKSGWLPCVSKLTKMASTGNDQYSTNFPLSSNRNVLLRTPR